MKRVLLIGLDGATWDIIQPLVNEGELPTFKELLEGGTFAELESTIPAYTIPAWNSLTSGKNPGKLGIFTFMSRDKFGYDFTFSSSENEVYLWELLSRFGLKVVVLNVPNVHYASEINGSMVVGWLYHGNESITYPTNLKEKLDKITGGYEIDVMDVDVEKGLDIEEIEKNRVEYVDSLGESTYFEKVYEVMEKRFEAIKFLLRSEWDFAFVVFVAPDRIQHRLWDKKILLDLYKKIDLNIKVLLNQTDNDTTVIMVSDHGFGPKEKIFLINEWLLREGYLNVKKSQSSFLFKLMNIAIKLKVLSVVEAFLKIMPNEFSKPIKRYLKRKAKPIRVTSENIDWENTKVFAPPLRNTSGELYLNVKNRESIGSVDPAEYDELRDQIIEKLKNLVDPVNGKDIPLRAYKKEEIYWGKYLDRSPDLIIQVDDTIQAFDTSLGYNQYFLEGQGGEHRLNGIFLANGPDINKGMEISRAKIYDVTPTILHLLNIPIPEDIDGRVLREIFVTESEPAIRKITYQPSINEKTTLDVMLSREEEEKIMERLKKLGYI